MKITVGEYKFSLWVENDDETDYIFSDRQRAELLKLSEITAIGDIGFVNLIECRVDADQMPRILVELKQQIRETLKKYENC